MAHNAILNNFPDTISKKDQDQALVWQGKIHAAERYYQAWAEKYKVRDLEEAYYGHQWEEEDKKYVFNLIFSSIDVKIPTLLFEVPVYTVKPKPSKQSFDLEGASRRAQLKTDALNFFAQHKIVDLGEEVELVILDAFFRFGVLEIGYSADWTQNPNAGKPFLTEDKEPLEDETGKIVEQPEQLPENERIYAKRIEADRFRVSVADNRRLDRCDWCGYWEYVRTNDLKTSKVFKNKDVIAQTHVSATEGLMEGVSEDTFSQLDQEFIAKYMEQSLTKIWKIWDTRQKRFYILEDGMKTPIFEDDYDFFPLSTLKFRDRLRGWYPLPVVYNWVDPQNEINDVRESARNHRKRFVRKFLYNKAALDEEELTKLELGDDGTFAGVKQGDPRLAAAPLENPNLGNQHAEMGLFSKEDFNIISGTTSEQRGPSESETATAAQISNVRSQIRESRDRSKVAKFLVSAGNNILYAVRENYTQDFWIKLQSHDEDPFAEINELRDVWLQINSEDFGDEEFDVMVEVSSISPVESDNDKRKMFEFLATVNTYPQIAFSPQLLREVAFKIGYRNERVLRPLQQLALLAMIGQASQMEASAGQAQLMNSAIQRQIAQNTPPDQEEIRNQIANQSTAVQ